MMNYPEPKPVVKGESFTFDFKFDEGVKPLEMVWIPSGKFLMGSPEDEKGRAFDSEEQFLVTLTDGFWIGKYPITYAHWNEHLGSNPPSDNALDNYPKSANWYEALMFCWELNRLVFYQSRKFHNIFDLGYRFILPTEAQWEYACRAGTQTRFYNGDSEEDLKQIAWYKGNNESLSVHPIGEKLPNNWGLYDMLGNVYEWCLDDFVYYPKDKVVNWIGKSDDRAPERSIRGGMPNDEARYLRCAARGYQRPLAEISAFGFRLCLSNIPHTFEL